jgi:hypothetical protein
MKLTDLFKFKLFERKDTADLAVVNENFQTAESEIDKRLLKTAVQNTNTVTEAGYALDARQANPNVKGSLGALIDALNEALTQHKRSGDHDGRYYTEAEINNLLAKKISASQYGAYFIGLQGDYWNIVTAENGVKFITLVNGCCILTSNTTCDIHLDILLRDNFGIYAGCSPHTHMFNMDSFKSALNMSKLTFDPNQTSVQIILSENAISTYDVKELLLAQNHYAGRDNFSGLRFTQDGRVTRKYYNNGNIEWGNIYVCQSAADAQAGTHSVMMHQGNIFRVDIYGAKYA